jgi:iron complex transport system permease protein
MKTFAQPDVSESVTPGKPVSGRGPLRTDLMTSQASDAMTGHARRALRILVSLSIVLALLAVLCLQVGSQFINPIKILSLFGQALQSWDVSRESVGTTGTILFQVRLPRVLLSIIVGASLASVGVALQALLRNPLADPYVLGISSGAALGASLAMLFGIGTSFLALTALPLCGFAGGLISLIVVYRIGSSGSRLPVQSLLLAGVILNAIFTALIMFITSVMEPNRSFGMMAWLMGTLSTHVSSGLMILLAYVLIGLLILYHHARTLNLMTLGDESARSLGVETERVKKLMFVTSAMVTGAVVSVSGMIGFIGMVVPHAVRLVWGADHRLLFPASALIGGMFLLLADTAARTLLSPTEIPVGIITALTGGPFFVYLLMRKKGMLS